MTRKDFIRNSAIMCGALAANKTFADSPSAPSASLENFLDVGQRETDLVTSEIYRDYFADGNTRGFAALEKLERGFAKMLSEIDTVTVTDRPAIWLIYNMGVVVKTRESLFSIDLVHRRALDLAPKLDFALITHNHSDHYRPEFYQAMDRAGKPVINNFIDNYGAADWRKGGATWYEHGGYTRATKIFKIKDVEIRTTLTDHNAYLIDYTTAFEIRVGGTWRMLHSGDCTNVTKLNPIWGNPDLWVVFPMNGLDIAAGAHKLQPRQIAFGHLWELSHREGRLTTPLVRKALKAVEAEGLPVQVPAWGERIV